MQRKHLIWALALYLLGGLFLFRFVVDDAYISFLFARRFAETGELTPAPGVYVQGFTNFLYVLISAGAYLFAGREHLETVMRLFLAACGVGTLVFFARSARTLKLGAAGIWGLLALATSTPFLIWTAGGLETMFLALQLMLLVYLFILMRADPRPALRWAFLGLMLTAFLTRWDSVLFSGALWLGLWAIRPAERRRWPAQTTVGLILPVSIYLVWTHAYYGRLLPASAAKAATGLDAEKLVAGARYFLDLLKINLNGLAVAFALLGVGLGARRRTARGMGWIAAACAVYTVYIIAQGDVHMMFSFRFYTPLLPSLFLLAAWGLNALMERLHRSLNGIGLGLLCGATVLLNAATLVYAYRVDMIFTDNPKSDYVAQYKQAGLADMRGHILSHENWKNAARCFARLIEPGAPVRCWSAGFFPFYSDGAFHDDVLLGSSTNGRARYSILPAEWLTPGMDSLVIDRWTYRPRPGEPRRVWPHGSFVLLRHE